MNRSPNSPNNLHSDVLLSFLAMEFQHELVRGRAVTSILKVPWLEQITKSSFSEMVKHQSGGGTGGPHSPRELPSQRTILSHPSNPLRLPRLSDAVPVEIHLYYFPSNPRQSYEMHLIIVSETVDW